MRWLQWRGRPRTHLQTWLFKNFRAGEWNASRAKWNCNVKGLFCFQCNGLWAWRGVLSSLVSWDCRGQSGHQCYYTFFSDGHGFWERRTRRRARLQLQSILKSAWGNEPQHMVQENFLMVHLGTVGCTERKEQLRMWRNMHPLPARRLRCHRSGKNPVGVFLLWLADASGSGDADTPQGKPVHYFPFHPTWLWL